MSFPMSESQRLRREAAEDRKRIAELEALIVRVEQQRNTMTAERDELESLLDEVWYSSLIPEPLDVWKAALRTRLPIVEIDRDKRIDELEADNHILTAELKSYFQQYGWESTERILKHHGAERITP